MEVLPYFRQYLRTTLASSARLTAGSSTSVVPGEQEVFDRHTDGLNADLTTLKHHWVVLFRDLLLLQWPKAAFCKTSWTRLRALGLGDPVDEIDFF